MKNKILLLPILLIYYNISSQDLNWLIINGNVKTGFDSSANKNLYNKSVSNVCQSNSYFKIEGIEHPVYYPTFTPRKDFFIIFADGNYFSSRRLDQGSIWPPNSINGGTSFQVNGSNVNQIKYFYLTNIYEEDDPPKSLKIDTGTSNTQVSIAFSNTNTMLLNQDFVSGKNVILILPNSLLDGNAQNYKLEFDSTVLEPFNIFQNETSFSFESISSLSISSGRISGIKKSINYPYQYFCFKVKDLVKDERINELVSIRLMLSNSVVNEVKEKIVAIHDPNFVKVKCIMKKKDKNGKDKFYALYRIQFQNSGNTLVDSVKFVMPMPEIVKIKNAKLFNWYFSRQRSCLNQNEKVQMKIQPNNTLEISFDKGILLPSIASDSKNLLAKGAAEICVELKKDPIKRSVRLLPINAYTIFNTKKYSMDFEYDPGVRSNRSIRPIQAQCQCHCLPDKILQR